LGAIGGAGFAPPTLFMKIKTAGYRVLFIISFILLGFVSIQATLQSKEATRYQSLSSKIVDLSSMKMVKWAMLLEKNPHTIAWLLVNGTSISTPVVQGPEPTFYLTHNFWGDRALEGCPFLEEGRRFDRGVQVIFGHHLAFSHQAFSDLALCWKQAQFNRLGKLLWSTPRLGTRYFYPLCSARVRETDELAQMKVTNTASLKAWLLSSSTRSTSRTRNWQELCERADGAIELVTCSELLSRQPWRTVTVFVRIV